MVAVIKSSKSLHRVFNYNENKVKEGVAEIIGAKNYPFDPDKMTVTMRLNRLLRQAELRPHVQVNSVHISLNFSPSENHLDNEKLMEVTHSYMEKLGFGNQPFLVYRHHDAGHPHCHIITTNITSGGERIDLHHLAAKKSENARKETEESFGLVPAEGRQNNPQYELQPIVMGKIKYGRIQSKKAITTVLNGVLQGYKYASLAELNAVLRQYNVLADRGSENSRVYKAKGLVYRILDEKGNPVGVPIKASDFYSRPTLKFLEANYNGNKIKRLPNKGRIKTAIDMALAGGKTSLEDLLKNMDKQGIHVALRQNDNGLIYGVTYVDHQTKCVFNGSDLGKQYSAKALQERCLQTGSLRLQPDNATLKIPASHGQAGSSQAPINETSSQQGANDLLDTLMQAEYTSDYLPRELKGKKRKRRGKRNNNQ